MRSHEIQDHPDGLNKKIALVAHDNKKRDLIEWSKFNRDLLAHHKVYATGTTGAVLEKELKFSIHRLESGPLGGDQQIGSKIVDGEIDFLIFFWDPLEPQPHDPGREGPASHGRRLEYPNRMRSRVRRLHYLLPADGLDLRAHRAGLRGISQQARFPARRLCPSRRRNSPRAARRSGRRTLVYIVTIIVDNHSTSPEKRTFRNRENLH